MDVSTIPNGAFDFAIRKSLWLLIGAFLLTTPQISPGAQSTSNELGGWATVEITPPLGIGLGGRGGPQTTATKVLDPLYAQVLFLKDSHAKGFALLSFDLIGMSHEFGDKLRTDIVHELGEAWDLVILNTSHTHSGPYMIRSLMAGVGPAPEIEIDYFKTLENKIVDAARVAKKSMKPVRVEVFEGKSDVGINRRGRNKQGKRGIIPDPNGPYDEKVWVMKVSPTDGSPAAVIFSYACHPVLVYGYAFSGVSADFPGVARNAIRDALGSETHAQFVQGFAGNIRPRVVADLKNNRFRGSKLADVETAGHSLADTVLAALKADGRTLTLHFAGSVDHPFLPRGEPPPKSRYEDMHANAVATTNKWQIAFTEYWLKRYATGEGFAKGDPWALGLTRISDDMWIVHSSGEPCAEWRAKIDSWLAPLKLVTFGYSESNSYLPTESMLPEGGYEVLDSNQARASTPAPFAPGIEAAVRDSLVRQLAFIKAKTN